MRDQRRRGWKWRCRSRGGMRRWRCCGTAATSCQSWTTRPPSGSRRKRIDSELSERRDPPMTTLNVLRQHAESRRFAREAVDDSRTAIPAVDAKALEAVLKKTVDGEVRFDKGSRALYSTDGSNYRQVPIGVVI